MGKIDLNEMFEISSSFKDAKPLQHEEALESFSTGRLDEKSFVQNYDDNTSKNAEKMSPEEEPKQRTSLLDRMFKGKKSDSAQLDELSASSEDGPNSYPQRIPQENIKSVEKPCEATDLPSADDYKTSVLEEAKVVSSFYLQAVDGNVIDISKSIFLVGCGRDCDFVIETDPARHTVSRKHAYIIIKNDTAYLKDLSSNGTFIGDSLSKDFYKLPKDTEVEIRIGQFVKFADKTFSFHRR